MKEESECFTGQSASDTCLSCLSSFILYEFAFFLCSIFPSFFLKIKHCHKTCIVLQARVKAQANPQARVKAQIQAQVQVQAQVQSQARVQTQIQAQAQVQSQAQAKVHVQAQAQAQVQAIAQAQVQVFH